MKLLSINNNVSTENAIAQEIVERSFSVRTLRPTYPIAWTSRTNVANVQWFSTQTGTRQKVLSTIASNHFYKPPWILRNSWIRSNLTMASTMMLWIISAQGARALLFIVDLYSHILVKVETRDQSAISVIIRSWICKTSSTDALNGQPVDANMIYAECVHCSVVILPCLKRNKSSISISARWQDINQVIRVVGVVITLIKAHSQQEKVNDVNQAWLIQITADTSRAMDAEPATLICA